MELIPDLPFFEGCSIDSFEFAELVACVMHQTLPNGKHCYLRLCLPGMTTGLTLQKCWKYAISGMPRSFRMDKDKAQTLTCTVELARPCVIYPLNAPPDKNLFRPHVIVDVDDACLRDSENLLRRKRIEEELSVEESCLVDFIYSLNGGEIDQAIFHRIYHLLESKWAGPDQDALLFQSDFLRLPRNVFAALRKALRHDDPKRRLSAIRRPFPKFQLARVP